VIGACSVAALGADQDANSEGAIEQMKTADATELMRTLLADESEVVQTQAAIALYRLTGEKAKQFPAGYRVD